MKLSRKEAALFLAPGLMLGGVWMAQHWTLRRGVSVGRFSWGANGERAALQAIDASIARHSNTASSSATYELVTRGQVIDEIKVSYSRPEKTLEVLFERGCTGYVWRDVSASDLRQLVHHRQTVDALARTGHKPQRVFHDEACPQGGEPVP